MHLNQFTHSMAASLWVLSSEYVLKHCLEKVKVDTVLIESDTEAKAMLDLIPILNITKLVLGTTKADLRYY